MTHTDYAFDYADDLTTWGVFENAITSFEERIKDLPELHRLQLQEMLVERLAYASRDIVENLLQELEDGEVDLDA